MDDTPVVLALVLLGGLAWWVVKQAHRNIPSAPDAPPGQPLMPLAPHCVAPSLRWLLIPSQED